MSTCTQLPSDVDLLSPVPITSPPNATWATIGKSVAGPDRKLRPSETPTTVRAGDAAADVAVGVLVAGGAGATAGAAEGCKKPGVTQPVTDLYVTSIHPVSGSGGPALLDDLADLDLGDDRGAGGGFGPQVQADGDTQRPAPTLADQARRW